MSSPRTFTLGTILSLGCFALLSACDPARPPAEPEPEPENPFLGVWSLVDWTRQGPDGVITYPFGEAPQGQLVYTSEGRMSAHLMRAERDADRFADMDGPTAMRALSASTFFAYWGEYTIDTAAATVTHHVIGGLAAGFSGSDQVRGFRFEGNDHLVLSPPSRGAAETRRVSELTWVRVN